MLWLDISRYARSSIKQPASCRGRSVLPRRTSTWPLWAAQWSAVRGPAAKSLGSTVDGGRSLGRTLGWTRKPGCGFIFSSQILSQISRPLQPPKNLRLKTRHALPEVLWRSPDAHDDMHSVKRPLGGRGSWSRRSLRHFAESYGGGDMVNMLDVLGIHMFDICS